jgi:hypothetical protein
MSETNKKILIVVAILAVVGVAGYFLLTNQSVQEALQPSEEEGNQNEGQPSEQMQQTQGEEASKKTQKLIDDITKKAQEAEESGEEETGGRRSDSIVEIQQGGEETDGTSSATTTTITGVRVAKGTSIINTETGEVVNESGERVKADAEPGTPDAPQQSSWVDGEDLPESTIKMNITPNSIDPAEFSVSPNQAVAISVTAAGDATEIFRFVTEKLQGVAVGVAPGKTRVITFNAPAEPGEYAYYSDVANHRARGAEGVMIVE